MLSRLATVLPRSAHLLLLGALAATLAPLAWSDDRLLPTLLLLPALCAAAGGYAQAFLVGMAYTAASTANSPDIMVTYFAPATPPMPGTLAWLALSATNAVPWALAGIKDPRRRAIGLGVAVLLLTVPPIGFVNGASPLMASGALFPGLGLMGVLLGGVLLVAMGCLASISGRAAAGTLIAAAAAANLAYVAPPLPDKWVGIDTAFGAYTNDLYENTRRTWKARRLAEQAMRDGAKVILFPESVVERIPGGAFDIIWSDLAAEAEKKEVRILVGVDTPSPDGNQSGLLLPGIGIAGPVRLPMIIGGWRPWDTQSGVRPRLLGSGIIPLETPMATAICYEQLFLWPHFNLLAGEAKVLLAPRSVWSIEGTLEERILLASARMLARLAGVPLLTATNRQRPPNDDDRIFPSPPPATLR